jgi:hypothetical protein
VSDRLFDPGPADGNLTERQQRALELIRAAGYDGLRSDELGAAIHQPKHGLNDRCDFCLSTGQELGDALRRKQLAQQRRRRTDNDVTYTVWTVAGDLRKPVERDYQLPEGY